MQGTSGGVYVPCICGCSSDGVYVHACQVRVTVGDSGHCCCVSAIFDVFWALIKRFGPRPATALSLWNPMQREVTVSNDPSIQL